MPEMQKGDFADADAAVTVPDSAPPSLPPYFLMSRSESQHRVIKPDSTV